ncbi:hypothetical protein D9M72_371370 [compost metagenome]
MESEPVSWTTARDTQTVDAVLMITASHNGRNAARYAGEPDRQRDTSTATMAMPMPTWTMRAASPMALVSCGLSHSRSRLREVDSPAAMCRRGSKKAQLATAMTAQAAKKKTTAARSARERRTPEGKLRASCSSGGWYMSVSATPAVNSTGSLDRRTPAASHSSPASTSRRPGFRLGRVCHAVMPASTKASPTATNRESSNTEKGALSGFSPQRMTPWAFRTPKVRAGSCNAAGAQSIEISTRARTPTVAATTRTSCLGVTVLPSAKLKNPMPRGPRP